MLLGQGTFSDTIQKISSVFSNWACCFYSISWPVSLKSSSLLCHWYFLTMLKLIIPNPLLTGCSAYVFALLNALAENDQQPFPEIWIRLMTYLSVAVVFTHIASPYFEWWVRRQWTEYVASGRVESISQILKHIYGYIVEVNLNSSRYWKLPCLLRWWNNLFFTNSS